MTRITIWLFIEAHDLTVEELSAQIGLIPDKSWRKGEPRGKTGQTYETNSWSLESVSQVEEDPESVADRMEDDLNALLRRVEDLSERFKATAANRTAGLFIGLFPVDRPILGFKAATLRRIAALGVDLEFDLIG